MSKKNGEFDWNDSVSLRDYFDVRLLSVERSTELALANVEHATKLAADSLEKRLDSMNEFRDQLKTQAGTFLTKESSESKIQILETKIESLQKIVYVGLGIFIVLEVLAKILFK